MKILKGEYDPVDSLDHGSQVKSQSQIQLFTVRYVWLKSADMMTSDTAQSSTLSMRLPGFLTFWVNIWTERKTVVFTVASFDNDL